MTRSCIVWVGMGLLGATALTAGCGDAKSPPEARRLSFREQIAKAQKEPDAAERAVALVKIGYRQSTAQDRSGAEETLRLAWESCNAVADPAGKVRVLSLMAEAQANDSLDNRSEARRAIDEAQAAVEKIKAPEEKSQMLARLAQAQGAAKDAGGAATTLRTAESLAAALGEPRDKVVAFSAIATSYHKLGKSAQRDRTVAAALDAAKPIPDAKQRAMALADIAVGQIDRDDRAAALKTFESALEAIHKIEPIYSQVYAMGDLAERYSQAGFHDMAHEILNQADRLCAKIPQNDLQSQALLRTRSLKDKLPKGR